jgi:hypothetical protein
MRHMCATPAQPPRGPSSLHLEALVSTAFVLTATWVCGKPHWFERRVGSELSACLLAHAELSCSECQHLHIHTCASGMAFAHVIMVPHWGFYTSHICNQPLKQTVTLFPRGIIPTPICCCAPCRCSHACGRLQAVATVTVRDSPGQATSETTAAATSAVIGNPPGGPRGCAIPRLFPFTRHMICITTMQCSVWCSVCPASKHAC